MLELRADVFHYFLPKFKFLLAFANCSSYESKSEEIRAIQESFKGNQLLMDEEEEHKAQISCLPDKIEGGKLPTKPEGSLSSEKKKSIEYLSDEYEDLMSFRNKTKNDLKLAIERLELVEKKCLELTAAIEAFEAFENYSYRNNLKIMELPGHAERESAEQTAALCLRLFRALGVEDISMLDIDTAHRVPDRQATNKPNATTCKFTRCLAKDKVISKKR